jgi:hypothetical protein
MSSFVTNSDSSNCPITSTVVYDNTGTVYSGSNLVVSGDSITVSHSVVFSETITIKFTTDNQVFETAAIIISVAADCSSTLSLAAGATLSYNLI